MNESPDTVHGRLLEAVHLSGYSAERACGELEWLLDEDRWKRVGEGFEKIDAFLEATNLHEFRLVVDQRKRIVKRLADLRAGQRATSRALGVGLGTVQRDLDTDPNGSRRGGKSDDSTPPIDRPDPNGSSPAYFQMDIDPTREAKREARRVGRTTERVANRTAAAEAARVATLGDGYNGVYHESCTTVGGRLEPGSVDLVFTDPPYHDATIDVYNELGTVAARVLADGASLITYIAHHRLPEIVAMLQRAGLTFFWPIAMVHTGAKARMTEYGIVVHWKPLLWFVKGRFRSRDEMRFINDLVESSPDKSAHPWQQGIIEARYYIDQLTQPGDLVFDPFCGGGTTAVAAAQTGRRWITCDVDDQSVYIARQRLQDATAARV